VVGLRGPGFAVADVALQVPGEFNVENAALALALTIGLAARGAPPELHAAAGRGLARFRGSQRRFEPWGSAGAIELVHDYAHHPTEVRVTLEAARRAYPARPLHVLFQPHQYSRTARFLHEFAESLRFADRVVVADVYGARVHVDGEHTAGAHELVEELLARGVDAVAGGTCGKSVQRLVDGLPDRCAAFVLGAGDIGGTRHELHAALALRGARQGGSLR
jgi:UDP-N-acetylmuramate--alanine ligase